MKRDGGTDCRGPRNKERTPTAARRRRPPCRKCHSRACFADGPPMARLRKFRAAFLCHRQRRPEIPFRKGSQRTGDADCHDQCAHWSRNDKCFSLCRGSDLCGRPESRSFRGGRSPTWESVLLRRGNPFSPYGDGGRGLPRRRETRNARPPLRGGSPRAMMLLAMTKLYVCASIIAFAKIERLGHSEEGEARRGNPCSFSEE